MSTHFSDFRPPLKIQVNGTTHYNNTTNSQNCPLNCEKSYLVSRKIMCGVAHYFNRTADYKALNSSRAKILSLTQ